jgi:hypothetical protein
MVKSSSNKKTVKLTHAELVSKLKSLDEKLVNIWLTEENKLSDEEIWEIFVVLLESRVEILKTCRDAGVKLTGQMCLPPWLEKIVARKKELRLRDIKLLAEDMRKQKNLSSYQSQAYLSKELAE